MTGWDYENTRYPGTDVLVNHLGIRDAARLREVEARVVKARMAELERGIGDVTVSYDLRHLADIHRHLFSDVYSWAGQPRTRDPQKEALPGAVPVHFAPAGEVAARMDAVREVVRSVEWADLRQRQAAGQLGAIYTASFFAHPFREGNTRALMVFTDAVAAHTRFEVDWRAYSPLTWMGATVEAMPHERGGRPDPGPFTRVIEASLVPRSGDPTPVAKVPARDRALERARALRERVEAQAALADAAPGVVRPQRARPGAAARGAGLREADRWRERRPGRDGPRRSGPSM